VLNRRRQPEAQCRAGGIRDSKAGAGSGGNLQNNSARLSHPNYYVLGILVSSINSYCELVEVDDRGYRAWARQNATVRRNLQSSATQTDPKLQSLDRDINNQHMLWEGALRKLLNLHFSEHTKRILKFRSQEGMISYREIDYIAEMDNSLLFCEIKSKTIATGRKVEASYKSGWKQVCTSHAIAKQKYSLLCPLLIIVDMSFVFGVEYSQYEKRPDYLSFSESIDQFKDLNVFASDNYFYKGDPISLFWLNSKDIFKIAKENNILTDSDVVRFRDLFNQRIVEQNRETLLFSSEEDIKINNPFSVLGKLKH